MAAPTHDPARVEPVTGPAAPADGNGARTPGKALRAGLTPAAAKLRLPHFDVRRKRPPVLSFLLRWDSFRRLLRLTTLLTLDFFAYDLNEPGIVALLEQTGGRLRAIIDDSGAHAAATSAESQAIDAFSSTSGRNCHGVRP